LLFPGGGVLAVHAIVEGSASLWLNDERDAVHLLGGDIALIRQDTPTTSGTPPAPCAARSASC
jgi:hypothetical protein